MDLGKTRAPQGAMPDMLITAAERLEGVRVDTIRPHTGLLEAHRVVDVLVTEAVGPAHHDERRREPRQVGRPRRRAG